MTANNIDPSKRRPPLRVQLTVLYAGLFILLVAAVLAVSGLLERQGSTNINGGSSSHNAVFGQHFDVGTTDRRGDRRDRRRGTGLVDRGPVPAPIHTVRDGDWRVGDEP